LLNYKLWISLCLVCVDSDWITQRWVALDPTRWFQSEW